MKTLSQGTGCPERLWTLSMEMIKKETSPYTTSFNSEVGPILSNPSMGQVTSRDPSHLNLSMVLVLERVQATRQLTFIAAISFS